ncbi:hypothetical protein F5Y06DRAFT_296344 [Hypoxylon sp. FL0890]|nr:hypothetical protein F5Y06DRAFT_296344 [Hypoxylon sp. FL0890]
MSICLFYRQIFMTPQYRILSLMMMIAATAWFIAITVFNFCYCIPIDLFWHLTKPGRCLNYDLFYLIAGIVETVIDVGIVALPIRAVFTVQLALKTKVIVSGIILLGGVAIITNIVRIYHSYQPNTEFIAFTESEFWADIHTTTTILSTLRHVFSSTRIRVYEHNADGLGSNFQMENMKANSHTESASDFSTNDYDAMQIGLAKPNDVWHHARAIPLEEGKHTRLFEAV